MTYSTEYTFEDALADSTVTCTFPELTAVRVSAHNNTEGIPPASSEAFLQTSAQPPASPQSIFFPGCSFINYGLPLVQTMYDLLRERKQVDGISLLCCGKILLYEPDGAAKRSDYEQQMRDHLTKTQIKRIVTACPNCVAALRGLLAKDERTAAVEVVALPTVLAEEGYRIDPAIAKRMAQADPRVTSENPLFCPKDSCPDRKTGEFARGLRNLMPPEMIVEPEHGFNRSFCCGSRPRAAGRIEAADRMALRNAEEALDASADALVTACVSCTFQLSSAQQKVPAFHYLELLCDWRIDWNNAAQYMKLRFLFDDALGAREFKGITQTTSSTDAAYPSTDEARTSHTQTTPSKDAGER